MWSEKRPEVQICPDWWTALNKLANELGTCGTKRK